MIFASVLILAICLGLILLDIVKVIDYIKGTGRMITSLFYPHMVFFCYLVYGSGWGRKGIIPFVLFLALFVPCVIYWLCRLHFFPFRKDKSGNSRVKILYGGRLLILYYIWAMGFQIVWYLLLTKRIWNLCNEQDAVWVFWTDLAVCLLSIGTFLWNGIFRVIFTSRQLGILKRLLVIAFSWVPIVNFFLLLFLCRKAKEEYDTECCRHEIRKERADSSLCATRYPILLLHGVGFRDHRLFNYWGRIPKELVHNGAVIYYGHQEGWGVLQDNAQVIKERIEQMLQENHCEKVNIIAHSKGGLDARYTIGELGVADKVASVTTICTPHHGSPLVPFLRKMPEGLYRMICHWIDRVFRAYGDTRPDVYHSGLELDPAFCENFNQKYPDVPGIYYQSYASAMKHWYSESLLGIPYLVLKMLGAPVNDGLVPEESAKWGEFKGTFLSGQIRGISHADMIDLHREDYKGFDVLEFYVKIVNDLKMRGF